MIALRTLYVLVLSVFCFVGYSQQTNICIPVKDIQTNETIPGVVIQTDKNKYYTTNEQGVFCIEENSNIFTLKIRSMGYKSELLTFKVNNIPQTIYLTPNIHTIDEVKITSEYSQTHQTTVANILGENLIKKRSGESLGKTIESIAGVNLVQTGATIVKPSINGMHGSRIVISNDNVRLASQQWGKDHAPEIDPSSAQRIEVIKGAEAVRYGADAMGGVIELHSPLLSYGKPINGNVQIGYKTNGRGWYGSGELNGSLGKNKRWAWRLHSNYKNTGDVKTADYFINNTGSRELNCLTSVGYKNKRWGIDITAKLFYTKLGIFYGSHIGNLEDLKNRFEIGRPLTTYPFMRKISAPRQEVNHITTCAKGFINNIFGGKINWHYSYQNNNRQEFSVRRMERTAIPALNMKLSTHNFNTQWNKNRDNWKYKIGLSFSKQTNYNKPGTGVVPIIPNFSSSEIGVFTIANYSSNNWETEAGLRFDYKHLDAAGYNIYSEKFGGKHKFKNFTYSIGTAYKINSNFKIRSNIGMAWRAPQVNELYSNGLHHGAGSFDVGDDKLKSERGIKWINSFNYSSEKLTVSTDLFLQYIKNYIYHRPNGQTLMLFSGVYPIFKYVQSDGFFRGIDANINYNLFKDFYYGIQASLIYADDIKNKSFFPFIAPFNMQNEIKWEKDNVFIFNNLYASISHKFVAKQNRYSVNQEIPLNDLDTQNLKEPITPNAYHLLGAELGGKIPLSYKVNLSINISAENLLNTLYKDYTNSFRYYTHDMGRNIQIRTSLNF